LTRVVLILLCIHSQAIAYVNTINFYFGVISVHVHRPPSYIAAPPGGRWYRSWNLVGGLVLEKQSSRVHSGLFGKK